MNIENIAKSFSNGEFDRIYDFIADDAIWEVVEEDMFNGKVAIVTQCDQVANYFKSVTTDFRTLNVVSDGQNVVVNGTAEFSRDGNTVSYVSASDLYEFNDHGKIQRITSYCIQRKN